MADNIQTTRKKQPVSFLKNAFAYSIANIFAQIPAFAQGFLVRRFIRPEVMGVWNYVNVVREFVSPYTMGVLGGASRALPILHGKGDAVQEQRARATAMLYTVGETLLIALIVAAYAFALYSGHTGEVRFRALILASFIIVFVRVSECYVVFLQSAQLYVVLSNIMMFSSLFDMVFLTAGAALWGLHGFVVCSLFTAVVRIFLMAVFSRKTGLYVGRIWDTPLWRSMASYGIRSRVTDYPRSLAVMLDVLWVTRFMGTEGLAVYSLARALALQATDVLTRFGNVLGTRLLVHHGAGNEREIWAEELRRYLLFQVMVSCPFICVLSGVVISFLIHRVIPAYEGAVPPFMHLLLMCFFVSQVTGLVNPWFMKDNLLPFGISNIVVLAATSATLAGFWFASRTLSLTDIATAMVTGHAVYFVYMVAVVGRELWGRRMALTILGHAAVAATWTACVLWWIQHAQGTQDFESALVQTTVRMGVSLALIMPLLLYGAWKTQLVDIVLRRTS